jgi:hypothetical protein
MALVAPGTIRRVAKTKRVSRGALETFGKVLKKWVDDAHGGNQTHAAKDLGVAPSHISAMQLGARGPGLNTLILLRDKTGFTLDQMLGLDPMPAGGVLDEAAVRRILQAELAAHDREQEALNPPAKRKRAGR